MGLRRARAVLGAAGLIIALGVGMAGPASAATITPIKPINPASAGRPITAPPAAPSKGPRIPFPGLSPAKIKDRAVKNAVAAKSVRVKGTILGDKNEKITWDALLTRTTGTMTMTSSVQGSFNVRRVGTRIFLAGDKKFWITSNPGQITDEQATLLAGKWVEILGDSADVKTLRTYLTIAAWTDGLKTFKVTKRVKGKTFTRQATLGLFESGAQGGVLYVATRGTAYPLGAESNDKTVTISYSQWNKKFNITAPPVIARVPL